MASSKSKTTIVVSIACMAAMTTAKFVAAGFTGSAAMTAEGIHSLVDTSNSALLYLGMRLSAKPPNEDHPFGYSKELYFWTLLVSLVMFAVGGCANVVEGIHRILKPNELTDPPWNYGVLGISFVFDCTTWCIAFREFRRAKGQVSYREGLERIKDPSVITVLFEDTVSLAGLAFAFLGIFLGKLLNLPVLDGIASVLIGLLLGWRERWTRRTTEPLNHIEENRSKEDAKERDAEHIGKDDGGSHAFNTRSVQHRSIRQGRQAG